MAEEVKMEDLEEKKEVKQEENVKLEKKKEVLEQDETTKKVERLGCYFVCAHFWTLYAEFFDSDYLIVANVFLLAVSILVTEL